MGCPTTTVHDKKELIRTLVKAVVMETLPHDQLRRGRIVWQDGAEDTPFQLSTRESVRNRIIQRAAEGLPLPRIAERLNREGLRTLQGSAWSSETVWKRIKEHQRRCTRRANRVAQLGLPDR